MESPRSRPVSPFALASAALALGALVALGTGCKNNRDDAAVSQTTLNQATIPVPQGPAQPAAAPVAAAAPAPRGERSLDTQPIPAPPAPAPAPAPAPNADQPIFETKNLKTGKVRTPSDENLPKWVPVRGRLTVVDSSDLAENLGLVPPGTTKKSAERISVADKLAEESAARAARADAASPTQSQGISESYAAGRFRSHR